ncbi:FAD/NAD(P)-binding protein [Bradyrhizobium japonicum]|uniref:FAD/NAD(P)-binding protein n=1 Tax=Bradyrhizobium japonicum TaxID=375 RepID=UPI001E43EC05|nr:FAD/NAD(P)-binding protein [Bradyrhizobium japonicum]MCD9816653.1 FAD/NAD(P)-binding protein [Bradyrhizobium japonicum]MEB2670314.1 FAD/NAD(P)-binding protein [Bradyrhizobium japonicum]WRI89665.1 FAD/NAD(P)-binding protein [Bradyrhizobium japonicum]
MSQFQQTLNSYRILAHPLYTIGTYDSGVTVLSQQIRALNLVWALVESGTVNCSDGLEPMNIAIVGGGFAGLTFAAGLLEKNVNADIFLFEERDTLLPLQQGSDSRWLHPHTYNWPREGSQVGAAMLPVMNWTAARASDVVVQVLTEWTRLARPKSNIHLYCNARHLHIDEHHTENGRFHIEWVGELRDVDGTVKTNHRGSAEGNSGNFDIVVLAVGFGVETSTNSYWRNETFAQPSLHQPRRTYLVSGQGDGAMIDVLRLCISQYRQDRILEELFAGKPTLVERLKQLETKHQDPGYRELFNDFEDLKAWCAGEYEELLNQLRNRLRRDTVVILHILVEKFAQLFEPATARISFQNKLLIYLLYRCGGFVPTTSDESQLRLEHGIDDERYVKRHGVKPELQLRRILSGRLRAWLPIPPIALSQHKQSDVPRWEGGYFGYPGPEKLASALPPELKREWRKEYLPDAIALLGSTLSSAIAGVIRASHFDHSRLRVTLHRTVIIQDEELLQQTCDYASDFEEKGSEATAGRTFPNDSATIGLAYGARQIIRTVKGVRAERLNEATGQMKLEIASRPMSRKVRFVLAIPLLEPEDHYSLQTPVIGVIYIDSEADDFFVSDEELEALVALAQRFLSEMEKRDGFSRIRNQRPSLTSTTQCARREIPAEVTDVFEVVAGIEPPRSTRPLQLNFDYSDFAPPQAENRKC